MEKTTKILMILYMQYAVHPMVHILWFLWLLPRLGFASNKEAIS